MYKDSFNVYIFKDRRVQPINKPIRKPILKLHTKGQYETGCYRHSICLLSVCIECVQFCKFNLCGMGLDDFQLFNERRKRKPLGDVTNQRTLAGINKNSRFKSFQTRSLSSKRPLAASLDIFEGDIAPQKQQAVSVKSFNVLKNDKKTIGPISIRKSISLDSGVCGNTLLLNLKRVLADSSFTKDKQCESSYFEFVHSLSHFNALTAKSIGIIKDFANKQRLHQLRSTPATSIPTHEADSSKGSKCSLKISVTQVSQISEFIVAVSSRELPDCLLLNTMGAKVTNGLILVLGDFNLYNLKGKDISLYTEWRIQK